MIFRRALFFAALFFGMFFFFVSSSFALTITPLRYRVTIDPGVSASVRVAVLNDEATPHRFRVSVTGVKQDSAGRPLFGNSFDVAEEWVHPDMNTFFLNPGGKKTIIFNINAPVKAEAGSHFLALVMEPVDTKNGEVGLSARAAALLSLTVSGVVNETLSIDKLQPLQFFSLWGEWPMAATLKNRGTVSVNPVGTLIVKNALGQIVSGQDVSFGNSLLPQSTRAITSKIKLDSANFILPGWYTINLVVHYGLSGSKAEAQVVVWYFPPWSLVVAGLCLVGVIFLLFFKKYRSKK